MLLVCWGGYFPTGEKKSLLGEFENALENGFEKHSSGDQTFRLGRVPLGLLHRGVQ